MKIGKKLLQKALAIGFSGLPRLKMLLYGKLLIVFFTKSGFVLDFGEVQIIKSFISVRQRSFFLCLSKTEGNVKIDLKVNKYFRLHNTVHFIFSVC